MKSLLIVLSVLMIALFASAASATVEILDSTGVATDAFLIDVNYADFEEDVEFLQFLATLQVKNDDPTNSVTVKTSVTVPTTYQIDGDSATPALEPISDTTLAANETKTITFAINVPHEKGPGEVQIGTITIKNTAGTVLDTATLTQSTAFMLSMEEISVDYEDSEGDSQDEDLETDVDDSFDLDENVRPGSEIKFILKFENLFDDEDYKDSDIDNIELKVDADDNDIFEDNFDDEYSGSDLNAGDDDSIEVSWEIPADVNEDDYTVKFTLEGEDGAGIKYELVKEVTISVEREEDDVRVEKLTVSPVTTCDAEMTIILNVQNFGSEDQDEVAIALVSNDLDIDENEFPVELSEFDDSGDRWTKTYTFDLPKNVVAKTYPLEARVYINTDDLMDNEIVNVAVKDCNGEETTTTPPTPTVITTTISNTGTPSETGTTGATTTTNPITTSDVVETTEVPAWGSNNLFIALIAVGGVLILALIGLFVAILLK